ncbi:hypothetical protein TNCV_1764161 [Trichonephila clavipes]|nr:hypothetical protein TNCV_1764161 [Trichonephila clavipes]
MGTTCTLNKEIGHLSSTAADRHPVSQRKTCLIGCMIASNSYTTLTSVFRTVYQGPYQPLWQPHKPFHQSTLELIFQLQFIVHKCSMEQGRLKAWDNFARTSASMGASSQY